MASRPFQPRRRDARIPVGFSILAGVLAILGATQVVAGHLLQS